MTFDKSGYRYWDGLSAVGGVKAVAASPAACSYIMGAAVLLGSMQVNSWRSTTRSGLMKYGGMLTRGLSNVIGPRDRTLRQSRGHC